MDYIIIFVAQYLIFILPLLIGVILFRLPKSQRLPFTITAGTGTILSFVGIFVASHLFYDPRPFITSHVIPLFSHPADNGFPSDHTTIAATLAFIGYVFSKKLGLIMIPIALAVGIARVLAHVHSWIDIVGGIGIAFLATLAAIYIGRYIASILPHTKARAS